MAHGVVESDLSKSAHRIAAMFDAIAVRYDCLNHLLSAGIDRRWRDRAFRALELTGTETLLDLCTGTGDLAIRAGARVGGARRVVGIDFAGAMLQVAAAKVRRRRADDRIALVRADATRIPARDASVDAVAVAFGIRNIDDVFAACAEMHRVLRIGGRLAVLEFAVPKVPGIAAVYLWYLRHVLPRIGRSVSRHMAAYSYLPASIDAFLGPDELVKILREAGFVDVHSVKLTFGSVILYTARRG